MARNVVACSVKTNFHKNLFSRHKVSISPIEIIAKKKKKSFFFCYCLGFSIFKVFEPSLLNLQVCENLKITFLIATLW